MRVAATLCRWLVGSVLLFSGAVKSVDPVGTSLYVDKYLATYSLEAIMPLATTLAVVLAVVEFTLGTMLILGYFRRATITLSLCLTTLFFIVTLLSATLLPVGDCGCFGPLLRLQPWQSLAKNVVLLSLLLFLYFKVRESSPFSLRAVVAVVVAVALPLCANIYSLRHLPIVDFMQYSVGRELADRVAKERAEENDAQDFVLQFRRLDTGEVVEFEPSATECWVDSNLEYVDTVATAESVEGEYVDFRLYGVDGDDYSLDVIGRSGRVALLCINSVARLGDGDSAGIARLLDSYPKSAIVVLKSCDCDIEELRDVETYNVDALTLRTIIRADIGVVILRDGVIEFKSNIGDI